MSILSLFKDYDFIYEIKSVEQQDFSKRECREELANEVVKIICCGNGYTSFSPEHVRGQKCIYKAVAIDADGMDYGVRYIHIPERGLPDTRITFMEGGKLLAILDRPTYVSVNDFREYLKYARVKGRPIEIAGYLDYVDPERW